MSSPTTPKLTRDFVYLSFDDEWYQRHDVITHGSETLLEALKRVIRAALRASGSDPISYEVYDVLSKKWISELAEFKSGVHIRCCCLGKEGGTLPNVPGTYTQRTQWSVDFGKYGTELFDIDTRYKVQYGIGSYTWESYGMVVSAEDTNLSNAKKTQHMSFLADTEETSADQAAPDGNDVDESHLVAIKKLFQIFSSDVLRRAAVLEVAHMLHFRNCDWIMSAERVLPPVAGFKEFQDVYIVMRKMETDLNSLLSSGAEVDAEQRLYILYSIAVGLATLHKCGVTHGNLTSSSILVNSDCTVALADFGKTIEFFELAGKMTQDEVSVGYMAPEVSACLRRHERGESSKLCDDCVKMSPSSDVWSYGVLMHELLMRSSLGDTPEDICRAIKSGGLLPISAPENSKNSNSLYDIEIDLISKLLCEDPASRPCMEEVLRHPYFKDIFLVTDIENGPPPFVAPDCCDAASARRYLWDVMVKEHERL